MHRGLHTAAALSACLFLSSCISMLIPEPEPFVRPVDGEPLRTIEAAAAAPVDLAAPEAAPDTPLEPAPVRTDVQGEGDGSMKVDRIIITAKDIPHRAPNYSPEQTASFVCLAERSGFNGDGARRAHRATVKAKELRDRLASGTATLKQSDEAELDRQDAIRAYRSPPIPLVGLLISYDKKNDLPKPKHREVVIEETDLFTFKESGKEVMAVSGIVRNTGSERIELPPITLESIDEWDYVLAGQTSLLPFETLEPGESREFELRFHNPPEYTAEVYVHFAPPFSYRNRRDCDFFDPATFNADNTAQASASAKQTLLYDTYSAGELNTLTQFYRRESASVWRCRSAESKDCRWAAHALPWRDMFAMADAIDDAWIKLRAAEETRVRFAANTATQAEVDKGDAARTAAMERFARMGDAALARAGGSAPDIKVDLATSNFGRDEQGLYVEIGGTLTNNGATPRSVDALMVAFVNRFDLPLSSVAIDFAKTLQPGETAPFTQRIQARQSRGFDFGGAAGEPVMARVPPAEIPWQVRVGAMSR